MMVLCPLHHDQATKGVLPEADQRRWKDKPYNLAQGRANGALVVSQAYCAVRAGGVLMVGDGPFVMVDDEPLLRLAASDEGRLLLSVRLYDEYDALLAVIEDNEWLTGDPLPWDLESDWQRLRLRLAARQIALDVQAKTDPVAVRADLWRRGQRIRLSLNGVELEGSTVSGGGIEDLGLVQMGIEVDTREPALRIRPLHESGQGVLVSEADPIERLMKSMAAYQGLRSGGGPNVLELPAPQG
jgi:hypothetical protein